MQTFACSIFTEVTLQSGMDYCFAIFNTLFVLSFQPKITRSFITLSFSTAYLTFVLLLWFLHLLLYAKNYLNYNAFFLGILVNIAMCFGTSTRL